MQPNRRRIISRLFDLKIMGFFVSLVLLFIGIMSVVLGVIHVVDAFKGAFIIENGMPGVHLIESVDVLLFSLVIFVLAGGIYKLFVGKDQNFQGNPVFAKINTFKDLKVLLWETLLLTLVVWASFSFFLDDEPSYEQLILPVSVLVLALSLQIVKGEWPAKNKE